MQTTLLAMLSLVMLFCGCKETPLSPSGHSLPKEAFAAMQAAIRSADWKAALRHMTSESHASLTVGLVMTLEVVGALDKEQPDKVEMLLKDYGLELGAGEIKGEQADMDEAIAAILKSIKDKPQFVADAMALIDSMGEDDDSSLAWSKGKLVNLKVDGDNATVVVHTTVDRRSKSEPIHFRKDDGGWLVHIPMDAKE